MLQRAASNAYSWWWASHIRTKQTKWVEQNLQDVEEKVTHVLKILEEEGDSFAKRAEMYYKRRPELISFVEETYKAYRALAERYDHISIELQKANNQLAVACPDRVPYMDDDEDDGSPRPPKKMPEGSKQNIPKPPPKDLKTIVTTAAATKKLHSRKPASKDTNNTAAPKSGLNRKEAIEEVDKLQKQILALQTVKEFVKSSYDHSIARYWETEAQINELQERVSMLQDELGEGVVIEDSEARRLMAEAALKSCQEALTQLEAKQEESHDETRMTSNRINDIKAKLSSLMEEFHYTQSDSKEPRAKREMKKASETKDLEEEEAILKQKREELQSLKNNIKEQFHSDSNSSLSVAEMAEKIDELVNKVISLETAVSSQTALVTRLRSETDELQEHIRTLEGDKESLINDKNRLNDQLREMEEKMHQVQDLNKIVEDENSSIQTQFTEARSNLEHISEKVQNEMHFEEVKAMDSPQLENNASGKSESKYDVNSDLELKLGTVEGDSTSDKKLEVVDSTENVVRADNKLEATGSTENDVMSGNEVKFTSSVETEYVTPTENKFPEEFKEQGRILIPVINGDERVTVQNTNNENQISQQASNKADSSLPNLGTQHTDPKEVSSETEYASKAEASDKAMTKDDEPDWQGMFLSGLQDREKILLTEYTNTLRNYKDLKKRLADIEMKVHEDDLDQLKKLQAANALKDEEIRLLRQKLSLLDRSLEGTEDLTGSTVLERSIEELLETRLQYTSAIEEKFRARIDELLDENLKCWREFGASFEDVQRFETTIKDLMTEVSKIEAKGKALEGTSSTKYSLKSDARPIYQHLTETQTLLTAWLERSVLQNEELERRFACLCNIQEDITSALNTSAEDDDFRFTSYQAAKFQGEVLTLKQEHTKFSAVLRTHIDVVTSLHREVEKALVRLNDQFGLSASRRGTRSETRNKVPLRSFIFGNKPKKQSIFAIMSIQHGLHKKRASKEKEKEEKKEKEKEKEREEKKEKEKEKEEKEKEKEKEKENSSV
ncbi:protein NETWORKED 2D-like [Arachis stenosperma]|uniref:protein NETWORKED 2D-like n=1 Tax=Arachis stenosperma TaxID=217475 RepID=UPI0025AC6287|nr:protein NETWORKED 2D-like [Arachis stenosperma]